VRGPKSLVNLEIKNGRLIEKNQKTEGKEGERKRLRSHGEGRIWLSGQRANQKKKHPHFPRGKKASQERGGRRRNLPRALQIENTIREKKKQHFAKRGGQNEKKQLKTKRKKKEDEN